jgi:hypothetical protein
VIVIELVVVVVVELEHQVIGCASLARLPSDTEIVMASGSTWTVIRRCPEDDAHGEGMGKRSSRCFGQDRRRPFTWGSPEAVGWRQG